MRGELQFDDWSSLRVFLEVARHGSMTAAGAELGLSQSAITRQVQRLERHVGQKLLTRSTRGVELTARGSEVATAAEAMQEIAAGLATPPTSSGRQLTLASFAFSVPRLLDALAAVDPTTLWRVTPYVGLGEALAELRSGRVDLVLGAAADFEPPPQCQPAARYRHDLLFEDTWAVLPPEHRFADGAPGGAVLDLRDLEHETWIVAPEGSLRQLVIRACADAGFVPHIGYETSDTALIRALLAAGRGVTLGSPTVPDGADYVTRPLRHAPRRRLFIAWHARVTTSAVRPQDLLDAGRIWYVSCVAHATAYRRWILAHQDLTPPWLYAVVSSDNRLSPGTFTGTPSAESGSVPPSWTGCVPRPRIRP